MGERTKWHSIKYIHIQDLLTNEIPELERKSVKKKLHLWFQDPMPTKLKTNKSNKQEDSCFALLCFLLVAFICENLSICWCHSLFKLQVCKTSLICVFFASFSHQQTGNACFLSFSSKACPAFMKVGKLAVYAFTFCLSICSEISSMFPTLTTCWRSMSSSRSNHSRICQNEDQRNFFNMLAWKGKRNQF